MDRLFIDEKQTRPDDDSNKHPPASERRKKASVTAIEARLSALQKVRAISSPSEGEASMITKFFPANNDRKK